jgi:hypothetical protein
MRLSVPVLLILLLKGMPADAQLKISGNGSPLSPENIVGLDRKKSGMHFYMGASYYY